MNKALTPEEILPLIPQQKPFRFIDEIVKVDEEEIVGTYTFSKKEFFYQGHFPGNPITPGVILIETMCQIGVVAFGIYLLSRQIPQKELSDWLTMFTDCEAEFNASVLPGDKVIVSAKKKFFKRMKLRAIIEMHDTNGKLLASCTAAGIGVKKK